MKSQKKKPRQRDRPKNKANRQEANVNLKITNGEEVTPNISLESKLEQKEPPKVSNTNQTLLTQSLYESSEALQFLQQRMRDKFGLQQEKPQMKNDPKTEQAKTPIEDISISNAPNTPSTKITSSQKKSKISSTKEKNPEDSVEKNAFIANLQKQMEDVMAKGNTDLPQTLLGNLEKLLNQEPISDVESSDEEDEYIEYVYKPRDYFISTLCNYCKKDLREEKNESKQQERYLLPCKRCQLTYYCSSEHMKLDETHRQLCHAIRQVADSCDGHVFYKCGEFSIEQFRSYRIITIRRLEGICNRPLTAEEQEVILFPRICHEPRCREYRWLKLKDCEHCGQVAFCRDKTDHYPDSHQHWCRAYRLFKDLIIFQKNFGRLDPSLPSKILRDLPSACTRTRQVLHKLNFDVKDPCEYAALSQIATCPLTAWYALKLCGSLKPPNGILTLHLIGAEIEFEVDALHKWELFFLHITPAVKELNVVFIGPELNPRNISFDQLKKTKCCRACRKIGRTVSYHFECKFYHDYCNTNNFLHPDLVCFFNAGLYRATGYQLEDTWPATIMAVANLKKPALVTSYTSYEAPLDMKRFVQESNRHLNVVLPPIENPFGSEKPERNFVSDDEAPLMFKNYFCFVVE